MRHATLCTQIAFATLMVLSATIPAAAAPPGYERWVAPDSTFNIEDGSGAGIGVPSGLASSLNSDNWGTPGFRPVDVEVNWYHPDVDWNTVKGEKVLEMITVLEVPNDGALEESAWSMTIATTQLLVSYYVDSQKARPIDIEVFFRREIDIDGNKVVVPRYSLIWTPNDGDNAAPWDFIPAMPYHPFMNALAAKYAEGWRPYDIEFAVRPDDGQVFGTALLTPMGSDASDSYVLTMWDWFHYSELPDLAEDGWQLLDLELPPDSGDQGPFGNGLPTQHDGDGWYFGIFVRVPLEFEDTFAVPVPSWGTDPKSGRPIDLEVEGPGKSDCKKLCEPVPDLYTKVWLLGE